MYIVLIYPHALIWLFGFHQLECDHLRRQSPDLTEDSISSSKERAFDLVQDILKYP